MKTCHIEGVGKRSGAMVLGLLALALVITNSNESLGQTDFFWSDAPLNGGAANSNLLIDPEPGVTGSLYLYYSADSSDIENGFGLDLSWSEDDAVRFTAAETFDFDVVLTGNNNFVSKRWNQGFGPAQNVQDNSVTGLNAFTFFQGTGVQAANDGSGANVDLGFDSGADAFLVARVDWERVKPNGTTLLTGPGSIGVISGGQPVSSSFGSVSFAAVPEPSSAIALVAFGLLGLGVRRRP